MTDTSAPDGIGPEQFQRVREIFESVAGRPPAERASLIERACGGDMIIAAEVERMLQADAAPHRLLDGGVLIAADRLDPGDVIAGHFRIVAPIGRGGMGEVYRAHDTDLGRDVALKILPSLSGSSAAETDRLARFRREAQVLASLNHSNIAAIHGLEEAYGVRALILELVEGLTLAERISSGPIPVAEAVAIARQIAEGLEAAHERGIVHRDLKPANIKLRPDGTVKLLDFGLAKVLQPDAASGEDLRPSPTLTSPSLAMRVLLGTPAYMSPEQARGKEADRRSDIWAFGAMLYEMLARRRAFPGDTISDTIAAVLRHDVDWSALDQATPDSIRRLAARCLDRDIRRRLRDIGEARIVLEDPAAATVGETPPRVVVPLPARSWRQIVIPTAAALVAGAAVAAAVWYGTRPDALRVTRLTVATTADNALFVDPQSRDLTITPDGTRIIYKGGSRGESTQLFVRGLDQLDPSPLTPPGLPKGPFVSPDGQSIGFFEPGPRLALRKVAVSGGPALDVARFDGPSRGATWGDDNNIIVATAAPDTGLLRVSASGGEPQVLTRPNHERGEGDHLWPQFLPGSKAVLFTVTASTGGIEAAQVAVLDVDAGTWKTVIRGASQAHYVSSGHLVYVAGNALWAVPFDLARLAPAGPARVIVPQILILQTGSAEFDVAGNGTLVYVTDSVAAARRRLVWVDRHGRQEEIKGAPLRAYAAARLSPDSSRVAVQIDDGNKDIWVWDFARETLTQVTTDPGLDQAPLWTADGRRLFFTSQADGTLGSLFWRAADGSGMAERLAESSNVRLYATGVLADGTGVLFTETADVMMLTLGKDRHVRPVIQTPQAEQNGVISPDGRWLAYDGLDSGSSQIFVRPFPNTNDAKTQVSTSGGARPLWARNGRELFYLALDGTLMSVSVAPGATWMARPAVPVIDRDLLRGVSVSLRTYDVSPDGQRFLVIKDAPGFDSSTLSAHIVVVQNWVEELKRFVPVRR